VQQVKAEENGSLLNYLSLEVWRCGGVEVWRCGGVEVQ
jgi:hypothetical protein